MRIMIALVLTAGGSRGAYQAGVLKKIGELPQFRDQPSPFKIVTGASAGAINGMGIASLSHHFPSATQQLAKLWAEISYENVFKTDSLTLGLGGMRWLKDLSLGGAFGGGHAQGLLDFSPLSQYLEKNLPVHLLPEAIANQQLYAVGISATSYYSGKSFTFIQGQAGHPVWEKSRKTALSVRLNINHVWASCAIPVVFQPVRVETSQGNFYFGDGALRLTMPCSPAIRLGAKKLFAIGIRSQHAAEASLKKHMTLAHLTTEPPTAADLLRPSPPATVLEMAAPPLAQILGVSLNSMFLDHLDADLEHLNRMNELLIAHKIDAQVGVSKSREPMKVIQPLAINPSQDLACLAQNHAKKMPALVRYLLDGLGNSQAQSADLMSYLLFHSDYTQDLIALGYQDATHQIAEIEEFFLSPS